MPMKCVVCGQLTDAEARAIAAETDVASLKGSLASANDKALMRGRAAHEAQEKLRAAESALAEARGALRRARKATLSACDNCHARQGSACVCGGQAYRAREVIDAALARAGEQEAQDHGCGTDPDFHADGCPRNQPAGEQAPLPEVEELLRKMRSLATATAEQGNGGVEGLRVCPHGRWTASCVGGPICLEAVCEAAAGAECAVRSGFHEVAHPELQALMREAMDDCGKTLQPWRERWWAAWPNDEPLPPLAPAQPAEHPASGGEKCMRRGGDLSKCGHAAPGAGERK